MFQSQATEMKHNNIFEEDENKVESRTRKVTPQYIRSKDFV